MPLNESNKKFFDNLFNNQNDTASLSQQIPTVHEMRIATKLFDSFVDAPADIAFEDRYFVAKAGHKIRLRYYSIDSKKVRPLIIFFPGNAFIYDFFEVNHTIISKIAKNAGCNAVMVECRLAPEHPYPAPVEDALEAVRYIFKHISQFNGDKHKVILSGFSSGANLAAVVTNQFRHIKESTIFHQLLISGGYDYTNSLHEFEEYESQDKMLDAKSAQFSFDCYSKESQRKEPMCSPYWEPDLSGLPPTTIMVTEYDGGRSQSEGYAKRLLEAGNQVEKIVLPGQTHGTIMFRKACFDGEDPAIVAGLKLHEITR